jgi:hypothetical protein
MASMASKDPGGHRSPCTVERAGAFPGKNCAYVSFISLKYFQS